ncbi:MAG: IclR family transcriptional regulator [Thermomicrobiales bacterium]
MAAQRAGSGEATYQVRALERGLQVLVALSTELPQASLQDLHTYTGLNKATLLRLIDVLLRMEFIEQDIESGDYHLGIRAFEVGMAYLPSLPIEQIAQPYLRQLMEATDLTANLGVLAGHDVVHVGTIAPERSLRFHIRVGFRDSLHWTALGKVLASGMPESQLQEFLSTHHFAKRTDRTITSPDDFRSELERVKSEGLAYDIEEGSAGLSCMAAPIRNAGGQIIAAISISGLAYEINDDTRPQLEAALKQCAQEISHRFGYRPIEEPVSDSSDSPGAIMPAGKRSRSAGSC